MSESQKISFLVRRNINPDFIIFATENFTAISKSLEELVEYVNQSQKDTKISKKGAIEVRLGKIKSDFNNIQEKYNSLLADFKSYNLEARNSFQLFGNEIKNFREHVENSVEIYKESPETGIVMSLSSDFAAFKSRIDQAFWKIENAPFHYSFLAIIGIVLSFIPFINIGSIIISIALLTQKDWRALLTGVIILILLAFQFGNLIYIALG